MDTRIKAVEFNEVEHKYYYNGSELHGVTGAIGKIMGKSFPDTDIVKLATIYGSDVHKEVENYFNHDIKTVSSEAAKWVIQELDNFDNHSLLFDYVTAIDCEVMVSDFIGTASKVDVVMHTPRGVFLFDIKTTSHFDREYCSLQLSVYKELYERCYGETVLGLFVLGTKFKRRFTIIDKGKDKVERILNMNKPCKEV